MSLFKKTSIFFTLLYILFFVKTWGSVTGNIYSHDDVVYYAQTASLVNDFDIDIGNNLGQYKNIYLGINQQTGRIMGYQPLGPTLLYLIPYAVTKPFVYIVSALRGVVFDQYDPLFFVVLCFFTLILFYSAGLFVRRTLRLFFEKSIADVVSVFMMWGTILPVYVFRRPIFGVIPELFLASLLIYCMAKLHVNGKASLSAISLLGAIFGLLFITRWNDIYLLPFCLVFLVTFTKDVSGKKCRFIKILLHLSLFVLAVCFFVVLQCIVWMKTYVKISDFLSYYYQLHAPFINSKNTMFGYTKNLFYLLFGLDWGMLFTMPILLIGGLVFIFNQRILILKNKIFQKLILLFTFWACFHVVLQWKSTGDFYGYRFLISLLPLSAIGFATFIESLWAKYSKIITYFILGFCFFNFLVILPFELTDKTSMLPDVVTLMGGRGWGNNEYFVEAINFYFNSDFATLVSAFARGYLAAAIFGALSFFGANLSGFSPKAQTYFALVAYKQYIAFLYPILAFFLFAYSGMISYNKAPKKH